MVDLGGKEIGLGPTYAALSRVTQLSGLLLRGNRSFERIMRINLRPKHFARDEAEAWLDALQ